MRNRLTYSHFLKIREKEEDEDPNLEHTNVGIVVNALEWQIEALSSSLMVRLSIHIIPSRRE